MPTSRTRSTVRSRRTPTWRPRSTPPSQPTWARSTARRRPWASRTRSSTRRSTAPRRPPPTSSPTSPSKQRMAVLPGTSTGRDDVPSPSRPAATARVPARPPPATARVPARADGVQLIGEMVGSGYRRPPALARRADGQTIQLTPLLYQVLEAIDDRRTLDDVAAEVTTRLGRTVTADNVRTLMERQLDPMGLLVKADGSQPQVRKSNPLLALRLKYAVSDPQRTRRLTAPFARLFNPVVVVLVLAAFAGVSWWVFLQKGLASATYEAFDHPGLLLLVLAVTVVSAGFHEFGHAAAARRGGATPGVMGAGVYLVWPAFYTDVTDSYRLGRGGRVRTDLGG